MARVTWSTFDRLTAAQVQTVSDQGVMRFADTTARDAALGVGVREVGMMSAVAAAPDNGAPRYWDGSAWTLVSAGVLVPNVLAAGDAANASTLNVSLSSPASATWHQLTAGFGSDVVLTGMHIRPAGGSLNTEFLLSTGAAASEVVRFGSRVKVSSLEVYSFDFPYGVPVPASTRVALRWAAGTTPSTLFVALTYYTSAAATPVEGSVTSTVSVPSTSWVQVAASPPVAGGVYVVGAFSTASGLIDIGLGAAAAEVVQISDVGGVADAPVSFPAFEWPASTRLAVRGTAAVSRNVAILWRESLT